MQDTKLSDYAKFHYAFLGKSIKSKTTDRVFTKGMFWDLFRQKAIEMSKTGHCDNKFILVDSGGWINGRLKNKKDVVKPNINSGKIYSTSLNE